MPQTPTKKPLAEGVWLLASGILIKAVVVTKNLAEKMMSKAAQARGETHHDNTLLYPETDGRASIPMLELSQKGYIQLADAQVNEHLKRVVALIPEYLKERGFIEREMISLSDKVEKEHKEYLNSLKYLKPSEISDYSKVIYEIQLIKNYVANTDLSDIKGIGLLHQQEDLIENIHERFFSQFEVQQRSDIMLIKTNIHNTLVDMTKEALQDNQKVDTALQKFRNELDVARDTKIRAVTFTMESPDISKQLTMTAEEFYAIQDTAILNRFAQSEMLDFPTRDYFGEAGEPLYDEILKKRFCDALEENLEQYGNLNEGYSLKIDKLSKKEYNEGKMEAIENRILLKRFVDNAYEKSDRARNHLNAFFREKTEMLDEIKSLLQQGEPVSETSVGDRKLVRNEENNLAINESVITDILKHHGTQKSATVTTTHTTTTEVAEKSEEEMPDEEMALE